jgi:hypothetical protein
MIRNSSELTIIRRSTVPILSLQEGFLAKTQAYSARALMTQKSILALVPVASFNHEPLQDRVLLSKVSHLQIHDGYVNLVPGYGLDANVLKTFYSILWDKSFHFS